MKIKVTSVSIESKLRLEDGRLLKLEQFGEGQEFMLTIYGTDGDESLAISLGVSGLCEAQKKAIEKASE